MPHTTAPNLPFRVLYFSFVVSPVVRSRCRFIGWLHGQGHTYARYDSSGRRIGLWQRPVLDNTQHSQVTDIHGPGGIRTRNSRKRAAADPRLGPLGQWDRRMSYLRGIIYVADEISVVTLRLPFSLFTCYIRRWHCLHHRACERQNSTAQTNTYTYSSTDIWSSHDGYEENFRLLLRKTYVILFSK